MSESTSSSDGLQPRGQEPRCLIWGVDTLELNIRCTPLPHALDFLAAKKEETITLQQRDHRRDALAIFEHDRWSFYVRPRGWKTYPFIIDNEDVELRIAPLRRASRDSRPIYVKLKSAFIWTHGVNVATEMALNFVRSLCVPSTPFDAFVSRLDLCADFIGLTFSLDDAEGFVPRSSDSITRPAFEQDGAVSGFEVGRPGAHTFLRAYDKILQVSRTRVEQWILQLYSEKGWDGVSRIVRFEFQLRGDALRQFSPCDPKTGCVLDHLKNEIHFVLGSLGSIWRYLVGAPGEPGRFSMRVPRKGVQKARWRLDPRWLAIQRVPWQNDGGYELVRELQRKASIEGLEEHIARSASSLGALRGAFSEDDIIFHVYVAIKRWHTPPHESFPDAVKRKQAKKKHAPEPSRNGVEEDDEVDAVQPSAPAPAPSALSVAAPVQPSAPPPATAVWVSPDAFQPKIVPFTPPVPPLWLPGATVPPPPPAAGTVERPKPVFAFDPPVPLPFVPPPGWAPPVAPPPTAPATAPSPTSVAANVPPQWRT